MTAAVAMDDAATSARDGVDRAALRAALTAVLDASGTPWAWQGPPGAPTAWDGETGPSDLDVWWAGGDVPAAQLLGSLPLPAAVVADSDDPARLRHTSASYEIDGHLAVVDITVGDLMVGPVLLVPGDEIDVDPDGPDGPALAGQAGAADLLVRPLLRGKVPPPARLAAARERWRHESTLRKSAALTRWRSQLGPVVNDIAAVLEGAQPAADLARRTRRQLLRRTVAPSGLRAAWRQRWSVLPAGRAAGPLDLRTRGVVVALVGTDGSGKSTVGRQLADRLHTLGYATSEAYFGMARGNLPGVGLARKVLGIEQVPADAEPTEKPAASPADDRLPTRADLDHPQVRQAAAWFYALEYGWRYLRHVRPGVRRREVVICDRYVYDLRDSPWPGSPAAAFAEWLVPAPDVLVLPDAPAELIHARKPERTLAEQAAAQAAFRALLAEQPARCAELILDTSGADPDAVAPAVAAVVAASHRPRPVPRA